MAIDLVAGLFVGEHELLELAGTGGFSVVWKARHAETGELRALKFPQVERLVEHLRQEAALTRRLDDPQVVPVLEAHLAHDPPHLVMPWVEGQPLSLPEAAPAPAQIVTQLAVALDLARVVERLHGAGVVHGDLKPGNVLATADGVRVLDLGLARLQVAQNLERSLAQSVVSVDGRSIAGTLDYMAPELFEGQPPSPASDLYALGILLHHLLGGRPPAFGVLLEELNPHLPPGAGGLVRSLLQPDRGRRLARAADLRGSLERLVAAERRCLRRRNGHERRRVFLRRVGVLRRGARALGIGVAVPLGLGLLALYGERWIAALPEAPQIALLALAVGVAGVFVPFMGLLLGVTTINAWIAGVPEGVYKNRPGHPLWSFMMQ